MEKQTYHTEIVFTFFHSLLTNGPLQPDVHFESKAGAYPSQALPVSCIWIEMKKLPWSSVQYWFSNKQSEVIIN